MVHRGRWRKRGVGWRPNGTQTTYTASACVATGCYTLTVNDSYGDGLQYGGVVGNYTLVDGDGQVLAQMVDGGNFGSQAIEDFCVEASGNDTPGCTDASACNYNGEATTTTKAPIFGVLPHNDNDGIGGEEMGTTCAPTCRARVLSGDCNDAGEFTVYPGAPGTGVGGQRLQ